MQKSLTVDPSYAQLSLAKGCIPMLELDQLWSTIEPLEGMYPGFRRWYWGKVVPGIFQKTRRIFWIGDVIRPSAVAIVKKEHGEAKICTIWVSEDSRTRGYGRLLLEEAIEWLDTDSPLFTIPAERYLEFMSLMSRFSFKETARIDSLYRKGVTEHIFNGNSKYKKFL